MGVDTLGKIKGYVKYEEILNFIKQKYDENAKSDVRKRMSIPIEECKWDYKFNEHSEDNKHWYSIYGHINFKYKDEDRSLFYDYSNVNSLENLEHYSELGLKDMIEAETTFIDLRCWGSSVEIIKEIVTHFGGGWIDENDCDDHPFYPINVNTDGSVKPIRYVTMEEIREVFGDNVVIVD